MSSEEEPDGETTGPSWTLIGAVLVVGVVVVMGVILSIQGLRGEDDAEGTADLSAGLPVGRIAIDDHRQRVWSAGSGDRGNPQPSAHR